MIRPEWFDTAYKALDLFDQRALRAAFHPAMLRSIEATAMALQCLGSRERAPTTREVVELNAALRGVQSLCCAYGHAATNSQQKLACNQAMWALQPVCDELEALFPDDPP